MSFCDPETYWQLYCKQITRVYEKDINKKTFMCDSVKIIFKINDLNTFTLKKYGWCKCKVYM
jgi:hypothetical protein